MNNHNCKTSIHIHTIYYKKTLNCFYNILNKNIIKSVPIFTKKGVILDIISIKIKKKYKKKYKLQ